MIEKKHVLENNLKIFSPDFLSHFCWPSRKCPPPVDFKPY